MRYTLAFLLAGCNTEETHHHAEDRFASERHSIVYYGLREDGAKLDEAADLWISFWMARGQSRDRLALVLSSCTISVLPGETVDGIHAGYWWPSNWIELARDAKYDCDAYMGMDHFGLLWARHEWTHALTGSGGHEGFTR